MSCEIEPVGLVELWANQVVELCDTGVFTNKSRSEAQLASRLYMRSDLPELVGWHHLDFIEDEQAPVDRSNLLHPLLHLSTALLRVADHVVGADQHIGLRYIELVMRVFGSESYDLPGFNTRPLVELLAPLLDGHV